MVLLRGLRMASNQFNRTYDFIRRNHAYECIKIILGYVSCHQSVRGHSCGCCFILEQIFSHLKNKEGKYTSVKSIWILWSKILVATIPALIIGLALDDWIDAHLLIYNGFYILPTFFCGCLWFWCVYLLYMYTCINKNVFISFVCVQNMIFFKLLHPGLKVKASN